MPPSFADTSTAYAQSKCQTSRPKCFLLRAIKSGFGHVAQSSPARGGLWFSMSSCPVKSAEQLHHILSGFIEPFGLVRVTSMRRPFHEKNGRLPFALVRSAKLAEQKSFGGPQAICFGSRTPIRPAEAEGWQPCVSGPADQEFRRLRLGEKP